MAVTQAVQQSQPAHDGAAIGLHLGVGRDFGRRQVQHGRRGQRILDRLSWGQEEGKVGTAGFHQILASDQIEEEAMASVLPR